MLTLDVHDRMIKPYRSSFCMDADGEGSAVDFSVGDIDSQKSYRIGPFSAQTKARRGSTFLIPMHSGNGRRDEDSTGGSDHGGVLAGTAGDTKRLQKSMNPLLHRMFERDNTGSDVAI